MQIFWKYQTKPWENSFFNHLIYKSLICAKVSEYAKKKKIRHFALKSLCKENFLQVSFKSDRSRIHLLVQKLLISIFHICKQCSAFGHDNYNYIASPWSATPLFLLFCYTVILGLSFYKTMPHCEFLMNFTGWASWQWICLYAKSMCSMQK